MWDFKRYLICFTIIYVYISFLYINNIIVESKTVTKQLVEIDEARLSTIHRINRLWRKLTHQEWEKLAELRGGKDIKLLEEFSKICDIFNNVVLVNLPELSISSVWSYAIIEVETHGINGLYKLFQEYQLSYLNDKNQRKWQDFAENVVQDNDNTASVSQAMNRIAELVEGDTANGNIYLQILKVMYFK